MTHYLVQPGDWIFVKGYELLSFARNMGENTIEHKTRNFIMLNNLL